MIEGTRLALFLGAALILALTPGPGIFYVLGRTLNGGRREGILAALGTFAGGSIHVIAAALGLSVVLATSSTAFEVVRYAGAAYLIYLGISMIRKRNLEPGLSQAAGAAHTHFLQGIATEALNPKTALFFLSFIPQFVSLAKGHIAAQFLVLGVISVCLNTAVDLIVVTFAAALAHKLRHNPNLSRRQRAASGAGMVGLGIYVAISR